MYEAYFSRDGTRIFYKIIGAGTPLFLLHGNGEDMHVFDGILELLANEFQVVLMDMRGHGKSDYVDPIDFQTFADDICGVMDHLNIKRAGFLGYSDGANAAMQVALSDASRALFLILNAGNLDPSGLKRYVRIQICFAFWWYSFLSLFTTNAKQKKAIIDLMVHHPKINTDQLNSLSVPVLVVVGDRDVIKQNHSEMIADSFPNAKLIVIKEAKHNVLISQPQRFYQSIQPFLFQHKEHPNHA